MGRSGLPDVRMHMSSSTYILDKSQLFLLDMFRLLQMPMGAAMRRLSVRPRDGVEG